MSEHISALPLFPLEVVLYPRAELPLHIFEERYKAMVQRCLSEELRFGVILTEGEGTLAPVGCTALIRDVVEQYRDGRLDIVTIGQQRFRLDAVNEHAASYMTAEVDVIDEPSTTVAPDLRERVITQHMKLLELAGHTVRPTLYEDRETLSYTLARNAGLSLEQKQDVLEMPSEDERFRYLAQHFSDLLPRVEQRESVRKKIKSNGHFEDFPFEEK